MSFQSSEKKNRAQTSPLHMQCSARMRETNVVIPKKIVCAMAANAVSVRVGAIGAHALRLFCGVFSPPAAQSAMFVPSTPLSLFRSVQKACFWFLATKPRRRATNVEYDVKQRRVSSSSFPSRVDEPVRLYAHLALKINRRQPGDKRDIKNRAKKL